MPLTRALPMPAGACGPGKIRVLLFCSSPDRESSAHDKKTHLVSSLVPVVLQSGTDKLWDSGHRRLVGNTPGRNGGLQVSLPTELCKCRNPTYERTPQSKRT